MFFFSSYFKNWYISRQFLQCGRIIMNQEFWYIYVERIFTEFHFWRSRRYKREYQDPAAIFDHNDNFYSYNVVLYALLSACLLNSFSIILYNVINTVKHVIIMRRKSIHRSRRTIFGARFEHFGLSKVSNLMNFIRLYKYLPNYQSVL